MFYCFVFFSELEDMMAETEAVIADCSALAQMADAQYDDAHNYDSSLTTCGVEPFSDDGGNGGGNNGGGNGGGNGDSSGMKGQYCTLQQQRTFGMFGTNFGHVIVVNVRAIYINGISCICVS